MPPVVAGSRHLFCGGIRAMTMWVIVGAMLLLAFAILVAMGVAMYRDVQEDKRDMGIRSRKKRGERSKGGYDLCSPPEDDDPA